jgi:hypothetical protein
MRSSALRAYQRTHRPPDDRIPYTRMRDRGTTYEPVHPRPVSGSGAGAMPDGDRRQVVTGAWLYTPAAPADVSTFIMALAAERWTLTAAP